MTRQAEIRLSSVTRVGPFRWPVTAVAEHLQDDVWEVAELPPNPWSPLVPGDQVRVDESGTVIDLIQPSGLALLQLLLRDPERGGLRYLLTRLLSASDDGSVAEELRPACHSVAEAKRIVIAVPLEFDSFLELLTTLPQPFEVDIVRWPDGHVRTDEYKRGEVPATITPVTLDWMERFAADGWGPFNR